MKKMLALLVVCTVLAGYVSPAFASGWHRSQSRMRKAHTRWLKQGAQFWKKFDAEMAQVGKGDESDGPITRRKQPCLPK